LLQQPRQLRQVLLDGGGFPLELLDRGDRLLQPHVQPSAAGGRLESSRQATVATHYLRSPRYTVQTVGRLEQHPHVRPVGQDVLPIQAVGGQLLHPTDESVIALGLQVVDEFLCVYVYPSPLDFCGDHRQTDVDGSVNLAPADLARTLAVNQDAFFYHKVALESKEWKMKRGLGVFLFDIKTK
jgi:hypothetical protein